MGPWLSRPLVEVRDTLQSDSPMYLTGWDVQTLDHHTGVFLNRGRDASERRIRQTRDYPNSYGVFSGVRRWN